jgi:hypothetical protein
VSIQAELGKLNQSVVLLMHRFMGAIQAKWCETILEDLRAIVRNRDEHL